MKKRNKILTGIAVVMMMTVLMVGVIGTGAWFSDRETSNGNNLTAGKLDLTIDGTNTNVVKFSVNPFVPGNQPNVTYKLKNEGNIAGYLDLQSITVTDLENAIIEPETEAGDVTDTGELSSLVSVRIMNDINGDGWLQAGDTIIYEGKLKDIASNYDQNILIPAGGTLNLNILINWWDNGMTDNTAQTDSTDLGVTFELAQTTAQ